MVKKEKPKESVGVVALRDGKFGVVEYSEIPESLSEARDANGELSFRAANIVNHFYTTKFLADDVPAFEPEMAFHIARKKIPTVDLATGSPVKPSTPNGMKLELFVFDVFPFCGDKLAVHEVARPEEFSPLKNAKGTGVDDQDTSRRDLLAQQSRWLAAAGATVSDGTEVELSRSSHIRRGPRELCRQDALAVGQHRALALHPMSAYRRIVVHSHVHAVAEDPTGVCRTCRLLRQEPLYRT